MKKRLYRSDTEKIVGGVCGGVAEYLNVDPAFVRIAWILMVLLFGFGILLYLICWVIIPKKSKDKK